MKRFDKSSIFLIIIGLFIIYEARNMGVGTLSQPGAGLFPLFSGLIILGTAIITFLKSILGKIELSGDEEERTYAPVVYVLAGVLFYYFALPVLGFSLTTFLLLVFLIKIVGGYRWIPGIIYSILMTVISYLIFGKWLMVQFPKGIFFF